MNYIASLLLIRRYIECSFYIGGLNDLLYKPNLAGMIINYEEIIRFL